MEGARTQVLLEFLLGKSQITKPWFSRSNGQNPDTNQSKSPLKRAISWFLDFTSLKQRSLRVKSSQGCELATPHRIKLLFFGSPLAISLFFMANP
jgi:hypothetical protein